MWLTNRSYIYDPRPFKKFFRSKQLVLILFRKKSTELKKEVNFARGHTDTLVTKHHLELTKHTPRTCDYSTTF